MGAAKAADPREQQINQLSEKIFALETKLHDLSRNRSDPYSGIPSPAEQREMRDVMGLIDALKQERAELKGERPAAAAKAAAGWIPR